MEQATNARDHDSGYSRTDHTDSDGGMRMQLVHLAGRDADYVRPRYAIVVILAIATFASPILCSRTGLTDVAPAAFAFLFVASTCAVPYQ